MNIDFVRYLPLDIIVEILSRVPVRTIVICKCVCKSWRDLLRTREFAYNLFMKSSSGIVTCGYSRYMKILNLADELDIELDNQRYIPITEFDCRKFMGLSQLQGSADGLLFLHSMTPIPNALYICNPITREYIQLPNDGTFYSSSKFVTYGFGVSKISGQYKVVRIVHECIRDPRTLKLLTITKCVCRVQTVGTGKWRSIASCAPLGNKCYSIGAFINGSLHWLATDLQGSYLISCFDLETEIFSTFSPPISRSDQNCIGWWLVPLGEYLCMCDSTSRDEIVIWLMKEYGDERSWTKEFVVKKPPEFLDPYYFEFTDFVSPIKVFKDGDILMAWFQLYMVHYSKKTKTTRRIDVLEPYDEEERFSDVTAMIHTSSFLSLKSCFPLENVRSF